MATKQWFVTMFQNEVKVFDNPYERLVYEAVKSFCGNGKIEAACSTREIAKRASVSQTTVYRFIPLLISKNYISQVGELERIGGTIPIYKVILAESVSDSWGKRTDSTPALNKNNIKDNKNNYKKAIVLNDFNPTNPNDFWSKANLLSQQLKTKGGQNYG